MNFAAIPLSFIMLQVKAVLGNAEEALARPESPSAAELEKLRGEMATLQATVGTMRVTVLEHRCGWVFAAGGMWGGSATSC